MKEVCDAQWGCVTSVWQLGQIFLLMVSKNCGELGEDNLAELDNTENNRLSAGNKRMWRLRRTGDLAEVDLGKFYCIFKLLVTYAVSGSIEVPCVAIERTPSTSTE